MTFEELFEGKEPKDVLRKFYEISQVPRVPGHMEQVSDFMVAWAKGLGLEVYKDKTCNVLVKKPASVGMEDRKTIILQAHLDMVCEKDEGVEHDFYKEPLKLKIEGDDKLVAEGTTLGADDGIGVAMIMALLEDEQLVHPPIEALFTIDEETDMKGAWNFDCSLLEGRTLINLDSFAIMVAGGGELEYLMRFPKKTEAVVPGSVIKTISLGGLMGGHTGQNSMDERGNAVVLTNRVLLALEKEMPYQLLYMQGGNLMSTAFARHASATVAFAPEQLGKFTAICERMQAEFSVELETRDPAVKLTVADGCKSGCKPCEGCADTAFTEKTANTLRTLLLLLPDGLSTINHKFQGCMESTSNVGVVETEESEIYVTIVIRSFLEERKYYLLDKVNRVCRLLNVSTKLSYDIPHWEYCVSDDLLAITKEIYPDRDVSVAQGTLETGIFKAHMPDLEIIALSCPYYNAHSPREYLLLSEVKLYKERIKNVLARL